MRYGLRVGPNPRVLVSTTPKTRRLIKDLIKQAKDPKSRVIVQHATTANNPHLPADIRDMLYKDYQGTRLGRQELEGLLLEDIQGALWTQDVIDNYRVSWDEIPEHMDLIVVSVDPSGTAEGDETGIVVFGMVRHWSRPGIMRQDQSHGFVLGDYSGRFKPEQWAKATRRAYYDFKANYVIGERNNGGDMVKSTIHTADPALPFSDVWASRGKARRAEPVSYLYEQGRVHHVGDLPLLEDQMTGWDASDPPDDWSPDRMDAMVWGASKLMVKQSVSQKTPMRDTRLVGRR